MTRRTVTFLACCLLPFAVAHAETMTGRVLDPDGKPLPGARVVFLVPAMTGMGGEEITTDAQGGFAKDLGESGKWPKSLVRACVYAPGYALGYVADGANGDIHLQAAGVARGRVEDEKGQPLPEIHVVANSLTTEAGPKGPIIAIPDSLEPIFTSQSGADGSWNIGGLPEGWVASVTVADPKWSSPGVRTTVGTDDAITPIVVVAGASLSGHVLWKDGTPAAGVTILATGGGSGSCQGHAVTAANGSYRIDGLCAGQYLVLAIALQPDSSTTSAMQYSVTKGKTTEGADVMLDHLPKAPDAAGH